MKHIFTIIIIIALLYIGYIYVGRSDMFGYINDSRYMLDSLTDLSQISSSDNILLAQIQNKLINQDISSGLDQAKTCVQTISDTYKEFEILQKQTIPAIQNKLSSCNMISNYTMFQDTYLNFQSLVVAFADNRSSCDGIKKTYTDISNMNKNWDKNTSCQNLEQYMTSQISIFSGKFDNLSGSLSDMITNIKTKADMLGSGQTADSLISGLFEEFKGFIK